MKFITALTNERTGKVVATLVFEGDLGNRAVKKTLYALIDFVSSWEITNCIFDFSNQTIPKEEV